MTTSALKKKLHKAIDGIEDAELLAAVYTIINRQSEDTGVFLTEEQKAILDEEEELHRTGKGQTYSWEEVKTRARKTIKAARRRSS